jgi:hypothetical protein
MGINFSFETLIYVQIVTVLLFFVSEYLGFSSCEYNGILHFVFSFLKQKVYVDIRVGEEEHESFETARSS